VKRRVAAWLLTAVLVFLAGCSSASSPAEETEIAEPEIVELDYAMTDTAIINPFIGFAVSAWNGDYPEPYSLVYIDITFAELQPNGPGEFAFEAIAEENQIERWRQQGKHAVLRFVCDIPGSEQHMDIPYWLYAMTADGDFYDTDYGMGYAPNYANEIFQYYHQQALLGLGQFFADEFLSYVKLGSLGHWGEWHVLYSAGIQRLPGSDVRQRYVEHYLDAFPNAKLLMRRPFEPAAEYGLGLFNDMTGDCESTEEWLGWIENGGAFTQTKEENALVPMPEFWKTAPVGGEFTSSIPMERMCIRDQKETIEMLRQSHTSFLGPKCPVGKEYSDPGFETAVPQILNEIGYRIGITHCVLNRIDNTVTLQWENQGNAPIYFETPVKLYWVENNGGYSELADVDLDLTKLLPGMQLSTVTQLPQDAAAEGRTLAVGIVDPMTGLPSVSLVSDQKHVGKCLFALYDPR